MNYPKVFIFGQPFNNFSGGGITLTNLLRAGIRIKLLWLILVMDYTM